MPYTYSNTLRAAPRTPAQPVPVNEQAAAALVAACTALRVFIDRPSKSQAAAALTAVEAWGGPLSTRLFPAVLEKLSSRQRTALLAHALRLYLRGEPTQTP